MRFYLSELGEYSTPNSDDPANPLLNFAPVVSDYTEYWRATDGRGDCTVIGGFMFVECNPTAAEHAAMLLDSQITYVPIETAAGEATPETLSEAVPLQEEVSTILEAKGIDITGVTSVQSMLVRIIKTLCVTQLLGSKEIKTGLDIIISDAALVLAKGRLQEVGLNTDITGTRRDLINHMVTQNNKFLKTHYGD